MGFFSSLFGSTETNCCAKCVKCYIGSPDGAYSCYMCQDEYYNQYFNNTTPILGYKQANITGWPPCGGDTRIFTRWNGSETDNGEYNPELLGCYDLEEPEQQG